MHGQLAATRRSLQPPRQLQGLGGLGVSMCTVGRSDSWALGILPVWETISYPDLESLSHLPAGTWECLAGYALLQLHATELVLMAWTELGMNRKKPLG